MFFRKKRGFLPSLTHAYISEKLHFKNPFHKSPCHRMQTTRTVPEAGIVIVTRHPSEDRTVHTAHVNHHSAMTQTVFRSVIGGNKDSVFRLYDIDFATAKEVIEFAVGFTKVSELFFANHVRVSC